MSFHKNDILQWQKERKRGTQIRLVYRNIRNTTKDIVVVLFRFQYRLYMHLPMPSQSLGTSLSFGLITVSSLLAWP